MIFAFFPLDCSTNLGWMPKKFFLNLLLSIENVAVFPNILFSRLTIMNFTKKNTNKCRRMALN